MANITAGQVLEQVDALVPNQYTLSLIHISEPTRPY